MSRPAAPWRWVARKGWYAWVRGKRVRLASLDEGKTIALRRLGELTGTPYDVAPPVVGELVVGYLESLLRRRNSGEVAAQTKADVERRLAGFAEMHGDRLADSVRPVHVEEWLASKTDWGATSRHDGAGAVRAVFRWALRQGVIDRDPLAAMPRPKRHPKRDAIPSPEDVSRAMAAVLSAGLRDLLTFMYATGCRPKEARTLRAEHIKRDQGVAVLTEHKTAHKTGRARVIYLPTVAAEIAYRLADQNPEGPVFVNARGEPWTGNALGLAVRRLRERAGLTSDMVAYALRHGYVTDALAKGQSSSIVAELVGHADLRMLARYSHLSDKHDALRAAAEAIRSQD